MPWLIVKRAAKFFDSTTETNPHTKEQAQVIKGECAVYPSDLPQEVPDWAVDDDLYKIGIDEGWLVGVSEQSAKAHIKREEDEAAKKDTEKKQPIGLHSQPPGSGFRKS